MSLLSVLRTGVKLADTITNRGKIQATVLFEHYLGQTADGTRKYASPVKLRAIVEGKTVQGRTMTGELTLSRASILILDVAGLKAATSEGDVDQNDRFTLPDGSTGPTLSVDGFTDSVTTHGLYTQVYIG